MQKNLQKELEEKIKNKQPLKIDLLNGVILDLNYDEKIKDYRGYWKEEDIGVGIWKIETLYKIATGEINNVQLIEN
jgi:hypothetical protein